ncbi:single-stranded DNA-binding protein [Pseudonocardia acidicola]|uniref:Single-stranded DNA-binding protein n=1 Tax=Pseudonocardia acidicola TaxID=2724939 RepID=A0ABX1SML1_9PSEU|nr:single-stranded DNA-binding protein [Pseudonocardia acidicola]NMI02255.1 single-stranded DNA-binding protein [Pseudonocardia acidicola]
MNEIYATVVGNIVGDIGKRRLADGTELAYFRVASNERRFDRNSGTWVAGDTSYVSVTCWRRLGRNVAASFVKGDPVMVYGRLYTREYDKDGHTRTDVSMDAYAVGPDLTWCTAAVTRTRRDARPEIGGDDLAVAHTGDLGAAVEPGDDDAGNILGTGADLPAEDSGRSAALVEVLPGGTT